MITFFFCQVLVEREQLLLNIKSLS